MVGFCNFGEVKFKFESLDAVGLDCKCQLVAGTRVSVVMGDQLLPRVPL